MPHTQIVFVKLKMELFEDDRFLFDLNDKQKLLFLLMLGLAGKTNNRVRNEVNFIKTRLNLESLHIKDLEKISEVFPKFKLENNYWIFDNFEEHHNWYSGSTEVVPKYSQNKNRIRKEKNKDNVFTPPTEEECIEYFLTKLSSTKDRALRFYQFYGSKGWLVGKSPMKNWHLAATRSLSWAGDAVEKQTNTKPFPTEKFFK